MEREHASPRTWIVLHQPGRAPETVDLVDEVTIGRDVGLPSTAGHVVARDDPTVSRLHAVLTRRSPGWSIHEAGSTNGVFVNGTRLATGAVQLLANGDEVRLGEHTWLTFHTLAEAPEQRTVTARAQPVPDLTPGERRVLVALCAPVLDGDAFTSPAAVAKIAEELFVTESAVKQQLTRLYQKFDIDEGPDRRVRLANGALLRGAVGAADLRTHRGVT
jgi:pSer/pThr/pTyr-binding forkhead associated (FHA) protein